MSSALVAAGASDIRVLDDHGIGGPSAWSSGSTSWRACPRSPPSTASCGSSGSPRIQGTDAATASTTQSGSPTKSSVWNQGLHGEGQVIGLIDEGPIDINHCFFADNPNTPGLCHRKVLDLRDAVSATGAPSTRRPRHVRRGHRRGRRQERQREQPGPRRRVGREARLRHVRRHQGKRPAARVEHVQGRRRDHPLEQLERKQIQPAAPTAAAATTSIRSRGRTRTTSCSARRATPSTPSAAARAGGPGKPEPTRVAKNAICVSAAKAAPDEMTLGDGTFGPTTDSRRKPDCGGRLRYPVGPENTPCETRPIPCGTSMAAPNAAAAAALARQYFIEGWYPTGSSTRATS